MFSYSLKIVSMLVCGGVLSPFCSLRLVGGFNSHVLGCNWNMLLNRLVGLVVLVGW